MADRRDRDDDDVVGWAGGGGSWEPDPAPTDPPPPGKSDDKKPWEKKAPPPKDPSKPKISRAADVSALGSSGVVCGRFLPVHRGHQYLIDVARGAVDKLLVIVFASPNDPIPGALRVRWLRELYPDIDVELEVRDAPSIVAPDAGELVRAVARHRTIPPAYFFASEPAYARAAEALGSTFVPVDPARACVPISGTALRADLVRNFDMVPACARPWLVRRVAVVGAESTGKSTLCAALADAYGTMHVPEYARTLAEARGGTLDADDLQLAARGQLASEDALARLARGVLFCDTDARTLARWAERLCGEAPAWIHAHADARPYDLVLVTSIDVPFVGAAERDRPAQRKAFHAQLRADAGANVVELRGDRAAVLAQARAAVDAMLARGGLLSARGQRMV